MRDAAVDESFPLYLVTIERTQISLAVNLDSSACSIDIVNTLPHTACVPSANQALESEPLNTPALALPMVS